MIIQMSKFKQFLQRYWNSFSFVGLVVATLLFAGSLTPSLLPRPYLVQGILSGFLLAIGYGIGVALVWFWNFLELPKPGDTLERWSKRVATVVVTVVVLGFVWKSTEWQNTIRSRMEMPEVETNEPFWFLVLAIVVAVVLVTMTRVCIFGGRRLADRLGRYVPRRISIAVSSLVVVTAVLFISNGIVARGLLAVADRVFLRIDDLVDDGMEPPSGAMTCGGPESLVPWPAIGRQGKNFLTTGPSRQDIADFLGQDAEQPIRVYVGMTPEEDLQSRAVMDARADLALREMIRVGGFDRKVMIVATPTGTGWLDEAAVDSVEYLHGGDTAIVATQYSYLPSWITILIDPIRSKRSGKALFDAIYGHWKTLDRDSRPELYLFGLSLGSLGCEESADLLDTFEDPIDGAVWSGPPFPSPQWKQIVASREPKTPVWLPRYRDGSMVRFTAQQNHLDTGQRWGPIRDVYIQHASDPMVWFSPDLAWQRPAWLNEPRGPDVSPALRWYPLVTFLQVAFDLPLATSVPIGYGHNYSPSSYVDGWSAVTRADDWNQAELDRLKRHLAVEP